MKILIFIVLIFSFNLNAEETDDAYIKNNIVIHSELMKIKEDIQLLKLSRNEIYVSTPQTDNYSGKIAQLDLLVEQLETQIGKTTSKEELTLFKDILMSRIDSSDESISNWGTIFGLLGTGWGVLITLITIYISYLNYQKAEGVVAECNEKFNTWMSVNIPILLEEKTGKYVNEIKTMRDEAEKFLLVTQQHANKASTLKTSENDLHFENVFNEPVGEKVQEIIDTYQSGDFAGAVIKAKFVLNGTITTRDKIEILQVISNSYVGIGRPELADEYNAELLRVIGQTSYRITPVSRANMLFNIASNRYAFDKESDGKVAISYLNDLISDYLNNSDIPMKKIVAKALMLKAIINENNGHFNTAIDLYKEIIKSYELESDLEIQNVIQLSNKNLNEILEKHT